MRTVAAAREDCPRCGEYETVEIGFGAALECMEPTGCGTIWTSRTAFDRAVIVSGIDGSSRAKKNADKNYISGGEFREELEELTNVVAYKTLKEIREAAAAAIHGREQMILMATNEVEALTLRYEVKALKAMEAWITGQMAMRLPNGMDGA